MRAIPIRVRQVPTVIHLAYPNVQPKDARVIISKLNQHVNGAPRGRNPLRTLNVSLLRRTMGVSKRTAVQYRQYIQRGRKLRFKFVLNRIVQTATISASLMDRQAIAAQSPKPANTRAKRFLHIWVVKSTDYLGVASFPWETNSEDYDGVVVDFRTTLTRFRNQPYHQNKTLVHEVGHWLGLLHTFTTPNTIQSSFVPLNVNGNKQLDWQERVGDLIPDTAPQVSPNYGNPFRTRRFPRYQGRLTAFMNFMDYTDDESMLLFTVHQRARAHAMWITYRA